MTFLMRRGISARYSFPGKASMQFLLFKERQAPFKSSTDLVERGHKNGAAEASSTKRLSPLLFSCFYLHNHAPILTALRKETKSFFVSQTALPQGWELPLWKLNMTALIRWLRKFFSMFTETLNLCTIQFSRAECKATSEHLPWPEAEISTYYHQVLKTSKAFKSFIRHSSALYKS